MSDDAPVDQPQPDALPDLPFPTRRRSGAPAVTTPFDPMGSMGDSLPESAAPMEDLDQRAQISRRRGGGNMPKFPSLETMYSAFPELRRVGKLRVQRIEPEWHFDPYSGQKIRVSGIVGMHDAMITTQEFLRTYGGYKFRVFGVMEQSDPSNIGGPPALVDIAVAEFSFPVDPNMQQLPIADGDGSSEAAMAFVMPGNVFAQRMQIPQAQQQQSQDFTPFLSFAERMANQGRQQQPQQPIPEAVFGMVGRQAERSIDTAKELAQQQVSMLERQLQARDAELAQMREQIAQIGQKPNDMVEMVKAVALINSSVRGGAASDDIRALQEQHARELEARQREFDRMMMLEKSEKEREIERSRSEMQAKTQMFEDRLREKEAAMDRRERELKDEFERRERYLRDEHKRSVEQMERAMQVRMDDLQRSHDREMRMRETMETNTKTTLDAAHGFEVRSLQNELANKAAELQSKAQLVEAHLAEQNKPLLHKVEELRATAVALGLVPEEKEGGDTGAAAAAAAAAADANAPFYQKLLLTLITQADTLLPQIKNLMKKDEPAQVQVRQVPPVQQARANLPPPKRVHRVQFADSDGPAVPSFEDLPGPGVAQDEQDRMSPRAAGMPPVPFNPMPPASPIQQPVVQQASPVQYPPPVVIEQAPQPAQQPAVRQEPTTAAQAVVSDQPVGQPASRQNVAPRKPPEKEPWSEFSWIPGLSKEQVAGFVNTIKAACQEKVPADQLVAAFIDQNGEGLVAAVPQFIDKDRFIQSLRSDPATRGTILATGKGKRYLDDVWSLLLKVQQEVVEKEKAKEASGEAQQAPAAPAGEGTDGNDG